MKTKEKYKFLSRGQQIRGLALAPILSRINDKIYETPKVGQHPLLPRRRDSPLREDKAR